MLCHSVSTRSKYRNKCAELLAGVCITMNSVLGAPATILCTRVDAIRWAKTSFSASVQETGEIPLDEGFKRSVNEGLWGRRRTRSLPPLLPLLVRSNWYDG
jgi:hypothetical protein